MTESQEDTNYKPDPGPRRRGPRFTAESHRETEERVRMAAVEIVIRHGVENLTLSRVAAVKGLGVSRTAPLHYFGTTIGMLAAVAEHGFRELAKHLRAARSSAPSSWPLLRRLASRYAEFGLERPHLWRAMHSGKLWTAVSQLAPPGSDATAGKPTPEAKARRWLEATVDARAETFGEFIQTAREISPAASVGGRPEQVAHAVTALVDGLIFQFLEERVGEDWSDERKIGYAGELVGLLIGGLLPRT